MNTTELQPGPELDRAVAEAIGLEIDPPSNFGLSVGCWAPADCPPCRMGREIGVRTICDPKGRGWKWLEAIPGFSTDWSAAMFAADRFNLWLKGGYHEEIVLRQDGHRRYQIASAYCNPYDITPDLSFRDIATAPTGQHAICLAILAIMGNQVRVYNVPGDTTAPWSVILSR